MRDFVIGAILLAGLAGAQDQQAGKGVNFYSREKEAALGAGLAQEVRRQVTVVESPAVNDYVNRIGARLAARLAEPKFSYTIAVTADDESNNTHEALSLPGGYIFVPASLIVAAHDEPEFAGMLAHAMSHVSARDAIANQPSVPLIFMGGWGGYGQRQGQSVLMPVGLLKFAREHELDADTGAVEMMSGAGFDPAALVRYIGRVSAADPSKAGNKALTFQTMPTTEERVTAMTSKIGTLPAKPHEAGDPTEFEKVQMEVRTGVPKGGAPGLRNLADADRPTLKRRTN